MDKLVLDDIKMHEHYMAQAILQAKKSGMVDEIPVGAIIVKQGKIIAKAHNLKEKNKCSIYHAEMVAIQRACKKLRQWRLHGCDIYVTLEPCAMCSGALINSRIDNIYFGAFDPKAGCCGSLYNLPQDARFNHRAMVFGGIMQEDCAKLLSEYFKNKRKRKC